jgi:rhomboid protease GluP
MRAAPTAAWTPTPSTTSCSTPREDAALSDAAESPLRITPDMLLSRRVDFERRMRRLPPLVAGLIAFLTLVFLMEMASDALVSRTAIVKAGALDAPAVATGEYWRLLSAPFLHGGPDHLVGNAVALFILGMICEHAFGRRQFALLYVASALGGSLVSLLTSPGPSVGASGAIFGLQTAAIVLFRRHRERLLVRDRRIGFVLLIWALYTIVAGLMTPYIDNGAHIGGAATGLLVARRLHPTVLEPMPPARAAALRRWLWLVWAALVYTGLGWLGSLAD